LVSKSTLYDNISIKISRLNILILPYYQVYTSTMVCDDVNFVRGTDLFEIRNEIRNERKGLFFWAQNMGWENCILSAHSFELRNKDIVSFFRWYGKRITNREDQINAWSYKLPPQHYFFRFSYHNKWIRLWTSLATELARLPNAYIFTQTVYNFKFKGEKIYHNSPSLTSNLQKVHILPLFLRRQHHYQFFFIPYILLYVYERPTIALILFKVCSLSYLFLHVSASSMPSSGSLHMPTKLLVPSESLLIKFCTMNEGGF
jgi:hypothetical protein